MGHKHKHLHDERDENRSRKRHKDDALDVDSMRHLKQVLSYLRKHVNLRHIILAVVIATAAVLSTLLHSALSHEIKPLVSSDVTAMHSVFFDNDTTWVVLCAKENDIVPREFQTAVDTLSDEQTMTTTSSDDKEVFSFGVLNCWDKLPSSGKTVFQRFNLKDKGAIVAFVRPSWRRHVSLIPHHIMTSSKRLVQFIKEASTPRPFSLSSSSSSSSTSSRSSFSDIDQCVSRASCLIFITTDRHLDDVMR